MLCLQTACLPLPQAPLPAGIYRVLHEGADAVAVVTQNMSRPLKPEVDPLVAEAAHRAEVPGGGEDGRGGGEGEGGADLGGCRVMCG